MLPCQVKCNAEILWYYYCILWYLCVFLPVCVCCTASEHAFLSSQGLLGNKVVLHGGVDLHHKRAKTELHTFFKRNCSSFLYFHLKCVLHNWSILLFSSHHDFSFTSHTLQVSPAQYCLDVREHCSSQCAHSSSHRRAGSCVSMYWNVNPPSNMMRYAAMHLNVKKHQKYWEILCSTYFHIWICFKVFVGFTFNLCIGSSKIVSAKFAARFSKNFSRKCKQRSLDDEGVRPWSKSWQARSKFQKNACLEPWNALLGCCTSIWSIYDLYIYIYDLYTSSTRTSRGRKFPKGKELYNTERICL